MKHLLTVLGLVFLVSCVSNRTREEVGMPAALFAWESGVRADVERGLTDAVEDGDLVDADVYLGHVEALDVALRADTYSRIQFAAVPWPSLELYGFRGIDDRVADDEMTDMVAESLRERMRNFGELMDRLRTAHYVFVPPGPEARDENHPVTTADLQRLARREF